MRYLIFALLLWSCSSNIQQVPEFDEISEPYIIVHYPRQFQIVDSVFQINFKCYPFNAPRWQKHTITHWRLVTDENIEIIDETSPEELEKVDIVFKKRGGHWIGITAMQDNGNIHNEMIHIIRR